MAWPHSTPQILRHSGGEIVQLLSAPRQELPSVVLTTKSLQLFNHRHKVAVCCHERSQESMEKYGVNLTVKANAEFTMLVVQTDKDFLLVYAILHPEFHSDDELLCVYTTSGTLLQNGIIQEKAGFFESSIEEPVLKYQLRFKLFLKITHGIITYLPLNKMEILLVTKQNFQMLNLGGGHKVLDVPGDIKQLYSLGDDTLVLRNDGTVSRLKGGELKVSGVESLSVNKHFNMVTLLTTDKLVYYNYVSDTVIKELSLPGAKHVQWSQDGNFMFVLFTNAWSLVSTFGCTMFHSGEHDYESAWLTSITNGCVLEDSLLLTDSTQLFYQPLLQKVSQMQRPILTSGSEIHIYTGQEMTTSINWNHVTLPYDHAHQLPGIRHGGMSNDGKFLALANGKALLIYSFGEREWSFYINDFNHDLCIGHLHWHPTMNLLIVTNKTQLHSELVVFDFQKFKARENFNSDCIVFKYDVGADIQLINVFKDEVLMVTDKYYEFKLEFNKGLRIDLVRVLKMDPFENLRCVIHMKGELMVLSNGELMLLKNGEKLFDKVEYVHKINDDEFYLFNGEEILLVKNFEELIRTPSKCVLCLHPDTYPLLLNMEKGLFVTIETSLSKRRHMELNSISSKNSIFLHDLLRFELGQAPVKDVYTKYKHYKNFQFAMELLLYQTVVNDDDLSSVIKLLQLNPLYELSVVSKCLRKIETKYWKKLLTQLGTTPQQLLNKSIDLKQFKILGILVIIFLNYQHTKIDEQQLINIMQLLYENANDDDEWENAYELLRFFKLLNGDLLNKCLEALS